MKRPMASHHVGTSGFHDQALPVIGLMLGGASEPKKATGFLRWPKQCFRSLLRTVTATIRTVPSETV
jgi:hypothetical protein